MFTLRANRIFRSMIVSDDNGKSSAASNIRNSYSAQSVESEVLVGL